MIARRMGNKIDVSQDLIDQVTVVVEAKIITEITQSTLRTDLPESHATR